MTQTFTLCPDAVLQTPSKTPAEGKEKAFLEPSAGAVRNILEFSRNLEVRPSRLVKHVDYLKS